MTKKALNFWGLNENPFASNNSTFKTPTKKKKATIKSITIQVRIDN